jgi:hypothetical protein
MTTASFPRFLWVTPNAKHEWKQRRGIRRLVPRAGTIESRSRGTPPYAAPFGLFREFAKIDTSSPSVYEVEIQMFADKYGDIIAQPQEGTLDLFNREVTRKHATLDTWCRSIQQMRRAVELWDLLNTRGSREALERLLIHNKDAIIFKRKHHPLERKLDNVTFSVIAAGSKRAAYPVKDILRTAREALSIELTQALTDVETPRHSKVSMTRDQKLVLCPDNLLAFMWLTFARVVSGEIKERRCDVCPRHIYIGSGPGLRRADTITCSDACRQSKRRGLQSS